MSAKEDWSPRCNLSVPSKPHSKVKTWYPRLRYCQNIKVFFGLKSSAITKRHIYFRTSVFTVDPQLSRKAKTCTQSYAPLIYTSFLNWGTQTQEKKASNPILYFIIILLKIQPQYFHKVFCNMWKCNSLHSPNSIFYDELYQLNISS